MYVLTAIFPVSDSRSRLTGKPPKLIWAREPYRYPDESGVELRVAPKGK